ncbi:MAG: InlB B-repeat-containing protein [Candidatus Coproplasma sp.]
MDKKLIKRIVTIVMACASISTLAFVGCNKKADDSGTGGGGDGSDIVNPADEAVSLNKTTASLTVGDEGVILIATVTPNTVSQTVTWTTSDPNVATVTGGYVVGVGAGTATITATSAGGKTATCTVTVQAAATPATEYTVTFNMNGHGTAIAPAQTVDGKITAPTAPTDNDYDFGGWYTDDACTTAYDFNTVLTANTTLYAKWTAKSTDPDPTPDTYTVIWKNGETVLETDTNVAKDALPSYDGEDPTKAADAQYTYTFNGWTDGTTTYGLNDALPAVTGNVTYTAVFAETVNKYTVTWKNGDTVLETDAEVPYGTAPSYDGEDPTKAADAENTYTFAGWSDGTTTYATVADIPTVTGEVTYTAVFTAVPVDEFTVTFDVQGHGTTPQPTATNNKKITAPTAPTEKGYTFGGWFETAACDGTAIDFATKEFTANTTVYAKWTATEYTVTFVADNQTVATRTYTIENKVFTAPEVPEKTGYNGAWLTIDDLDELGDKTVQAVYSAIEYTITYELDGGINASSNPEKYTIESAAITLAAPTKSGYTFDGWYNGTTKVETISQGSTGDLTLTAKWTAASTPDPDPEPSDYTANGTYTLDIAGGADSTLFTTTAVSSDGGYKAGSYFKIGSGDSITVTMKLQAGKVIKVTGSALPSNTANATSFKITEGTGTTGAVDSYGDELSVTGTDATDINYVINVTTEGTIVLSISRGSVKSTGCLVTALTVTVTDAGPVAVTGISLNKTTSELKVGATETLTATVTPANADNTNVTWSSSDETIATVDNNGKVTALKAGEVIITATAEGDTSKTATCTYTVSNVAVTGISFAGSSSMIGINDTITLTPIFTPADATIKTVTWSSSDSAIATVENGVVKGVAVGTATITATSTDGGFTATYTVEVLAAIVKVESVTFANTTGTANTETEEKQIQLTPIFTPADATNKNVTWTSDNPTVASVDSNGLVTAYKKSGTAVITVTTEDGEKTATYTLTVEGPAVTATTPQITKQSADELETAYVEWTVENTEGVWFNVYYMADNGSTWTKLDAPLVRQYADYYRADMVGLKAGTYKMKVVPVVDDVEDTALEQTANNITVKAHDRSGYAFADSKVPGAYNLDGTLKANAKVIYVTAATAKTVTCTVNDKGKPVESVGFQTILDDRQGSGDTTPLCFRLIGTINKTDLDHISSSAEGLQIKETSNITIEGIGNDATIKGWGMLIRSCSEVEVRNLGILNFMDDGVSVDTANNYLWIHNLDLFYGGPGGDSDQAKGDGSVDIKKSYYCTVSYNHFWDSGKCCLLDASEGSGTNASDFMTYHHNWFDHSDSRHPRVRNASAVHVYNNYYDGNSKYGVGGTTGSSTFVEANYFRSTSTLRPMMISGQGTDAAGDGTFSSETGGMIKSFANVYDTTGGGKLALITQNDSATNFDCYEASSRDEQVPSSYKTLDGNYTYDNFDTAADFYTYTADTAEQAKENVERYAGRLDGGDFKWEFNDAVDDEDYGVNAALKSAVVNYSGTVLKIGDTTVSSGGGSTGGETGGGESGGETGGETGGESGGSTTPVEGDAIIYCASGDSSLTENGVTISGNYKSGLSVTVNGKTVSNPLKMESSTSVTFTLSGTYTIKLYVVDGNGAVAASTKIKVNGTAVTSDSSGIATATGITGSVSITKGDSCNLVYISLTKTA